MDKEDHGPDRLEEQSVEDVAENIMGVEQPQRSKRFRDMVAVAEKYYDALETASSESSPGMIENLRERLDELEEPFGDNPAYIAFLRLQRNAKGLG